MTESLSQLSIWIVSGGDVVLSWLLTLPRDLSLFVFALLTALLMTGARRWVTNQERLQRCAQDIRQLRQLIREAKRSGDALYVARLRATQMLVKQVALAADLKVLAAVILPVAALAIWAAERLDYFPISQCESVIVRAYYPFSSIDTVTHLVPGADIQLRSPAIRLVQPEGEPPVGGSAEWTLAPTTSADRIDLTIRHLGESVEHSISVGGSTYLPPLLEHFQSRIQLTEVALARYRPLGVDWRTEAIGLPPWMVGYLLLTLVLVPGLKRLLRVS